MAHDGSLIKESKIQGIPSELVKPCELHGGSRPLVPPTLDKTRAQTHSSTWSALCLLSSLCQT